MSTPFAVGFTETPGEVAVDALAVQGDLPGWLAGTLVRNGPGTFRVGSQTYRHWFDGLAMLHRFSFQGNRVAYANKYLRSKSYLGAKEAGRITHAEFATDPCRTLLERMMAVFRPQITDSAKVNVAQIAGRYLALAETPIQVEFDVQTLQTMGTFSYEQRIVGQMTTVHPQFDHVNDWTYNVVTRYHALSHYHLYRIAASGQVKRLGAVRALHPAYMHSFGMSERYVILTEFPFVVNSVDLLLWLKPYIENFRWEPERGTHFTVVDRFTGEVVGRYESDPFFAFHHVNAFEQQDELVVDLVSYDDAGIIQSYYLQRLNDPVSELPFGTLRRYRIPIRKHHGQVKEEVIAEACLELPRFDYERYNTVGDYRYVYACGINPMQRKGFYNQIVKVDISTGQVQSWYEAGCYPGEPVFVGRPGRTREDDGALLAVVLDAAHGNSFLLVLDAHTLQEMARAEVPYPILFGYHGEFFTSAGEWMDHEHNTDD
jgi:beta,beta-carotene 9',10'-dioxygenase